MVITLKSHPFRLWHLIISLIVFAAYIAVEQSGTIISEGDRWPLRIVFGAGLMLGFRYDWKVLLHAFTPMISGTFVALILCMIPLRYMTMENFVWAEYGLMALAIPSAIVILFGILLGMGIRVVATDLGRGAVATK